MLLFFRFGPFIKGNEPSDFLHQSECATTLKTTALSDIILIGYINGSIVVSNNLPSKLHVIVIMI